MRKQLLFILLLLIGLNDANAQQSKYFEVGVGLGAMHFNDFATSPLNYSGPMADLSLGYFSNSASRETQLGLKIGAGLTIDQTETAPTASKVYKLDLNYTKLFALTDSEDLNMKVGGELNLLSTFRINGGLMNNGFGLDASPSFMGVAKVSKDLSSSSRKRSLDFQVNAGIVNGQYRDNYIYTTHSHVLNGSKYEDASFDFFKGIRLNTSLDYIYHLSNKNAVKLSYVWDMYKTTGVEDDYQIASHTLRFILLFNTNNK